MVVLSLISTIFKVVAPFGIKFGLSLRYRLSRGAVRDNPTLDALLLLPLFQKILSHEVYLEASAKPTRLDMWADRVFDRIFGPDKKGAHRGTVQSPKQLLVLERYLRPVLVPNEKWSDVERWRFHTRFVKFARSEYLLARHGEDLKAALDKHTKMQQGPQMSKEPPTLVRMLIGDKSNKAEFLSVNLPSSRTLMTAFNMTTWKRTKDPKSAWKRMTKVTKELDGYMVGGISARLPVLDDFTDMTDISLEDILELAGANVANSGPFNVLCDENKIYQFWTKEYIEGLADYLKSRSTSNTVILDIGAGDGLLAQLLREELQVKHSGNTPTVIAIDDGSWRIPKKAEVEKLTAVAAVKRYSAAHHVIVLCSWMPLGVDWTASFRACGVDEYILIGEYHDGNCGDNWKTWGNSDYRDPGETDLTPPFEADGFKAHELTSLSPHSFSIFDSAASSNSMTISFRKIHSQK